MNEHTPKSWEVIEGFSPAVKEIKGPSFTIAAVMWATDLTEKDFQNRHDDLRLIAAAPDLLNALENLADYIDERAGDNECRPLENARAAIAKAKGEA